MSNRNKEYADLLRKCARKLEIMEDDISIKTIVEIENLSKSIIEEGKILRSSDETVYKEFLRENANQFKLKDEGYTEEELDEIIASMKGKIFNVNSINSEEYGIKE